MNRPQTHVNEPSANTDDVADDTDATLKPDVSIHFPAGQVIHVNGNMNIYIWALHHPTIWTGRSHLNY